MRSSTVSLKIVRRFFIIFLASSLSILYGIELGFKTLILSDLAFPGLLITQVLILIRDGSWKRKLQENSSIIAIVAVAFLLLFLSSFLPGRLNPASIKELIRIAYSFVFFILIVSLDTNDHEFVLISKALVITGMVTNLISITALALYSFFDIQTIFVNARYIFGLASHHGFAHFNQTYAFMGLFFVTLNIFLVIKYPARKSYLLFLVINLIGMIFTFQKENVYLFLIGFLLVFLLVKRRKKKFWLSSTLFFSYLCLQALVFFSAVIFFFPIVARNGLDQSKPILSYPKYFYYYQYKGGLRMFADNPLFGVGFSQYGSRLYDYLDPEEVEAHSGNRFLELTFSKEIAANTGFYSDPHSTWIKIAAESGLLGLTAFFLIFIFVIAKLYRKYKTSERLSLAVMFSLLASLMVLGIQTNFLHLKIFWVFAGLSLALCRDKENSCQA
jgi:O-antigen ligase